MKVSINKKQKRYIKSEITISYKSQNIEHVNEVLNNIISEATLRTYGGVEIIPVLKDRSVN